MTIKLSVFILSSLLGVFVGCAKKNTKHGYMIFHNETLVASGKIMKPIPMTNEEVWNSLGGLELEAAHVNGKPFQFEADENASGVMTLTGEIQIVARGQNVDLREIRFLKRKGTHGGPYMTPSGWMVDPKQVSEIANLPKKKR